MSAVDVVLRAGAINGECPTWSAAEGVLYWCDTFANALHRFDPATGEDTYWEMPATTGSFALGAGDRMLIALRTGIWRFDRGTAALAPFAGAPFDPRRFFWNDGKTDPGGRFWVGTAFFPLHGRGAGAKSGALHRVEPGGMQSPRTAPVRISNGLAWSPDGRTMYHADTASGEIGAYDVLDVDAGTLGERRPFANAAVERGGPDGAATDTDGCYWSAIYNGAKVVRYAPGGRIEREVAIPVPLVTMIAFGGADLRTAYVVTGGRAIGGGPSADPLAGAVFAFDAPAPGVAIPLLDDGYFA